MKRVMTLPRVALSLLLVALATVPAGADDTAGTPTDTAAQSSPESAVRLPVACPDDFDELWARAQAQLMPLRPSELDASGPGPVSFAVTETVTWPGWWQPPRDLSATPVLHIVESGDPTPRRAPSDGRGHLYVPCRPAGKSLANWYLCGLTEPTPGGLMASVLAARQALDLVLTCPGLTATRVAVIGDGYGAVMALAVAMLAPDRVSFVVAHQPRPAFHRLRDGTLTSCPDIARLLRNMAGAKASATFAGLAYHDALSFAARVKRPTLVIAGGRDREAPLAEVSMVYDALTCPRSSMVMDTMAHRPSDEIADLARILVAAAASAAQVEQPGSPGPRAAVTSP
ncbi:MAG TPA: acetylxylan esterase [Armatimonadota bacterium]|nr:acetylxylan esterase [Armatimonadota bacterium]